LEVIDVYDAIEYVKEHYSEYILDKEVVYFEAGSGGGGNAFAIAAKFPDYFAHVVSMSGMSDYALWYRNDKVGEFRDELDVWVGDIANGTAYAARSGLKLLENLNTPMAIMHGELDRRVPEEHSALYVKRAREIGKGKLVTYLNLRNIGGRVHYEFMDDNHLLTMETFFDSEREKYCEPTKLPRQGTLLIGGYLYTKHFRIMLDSMDKMAQVTYNLDTNEFKVSGVSEDEYTLTVL
jgi:predicted peptidase